MNTDPQPWQKAKMQVRGQAGASKYERDGHGQPHQRDEVAATRLHGGQASTTQVFPSIPMI